MPVDFRDAAKRHWEDAELLFGHSRLANADHLFGLATECALKSVMVHGGSLPKKYYKHVNELWPMFITFAQDRSDTRYISALGEKNLFDDWQADQRYHKQNMFSQDTVAHHRRAAKKTMEIMNNALLDGTQ